MLISRLFVESLHRQEVSLGRRVAGHSFTVQPNLLDEIPFCSRIGSTNGGDQYRSQVLWISLRRVRDQQGETLKLRNDALDEVVPIARVSMCFVYFTQHFHFFEKNLSFKCKCQLHVDDRIWKRCKSPIQVRCVWRFEQIKCVFKSYSSNGGTDKIRD